MFSQHDSRAKALLAVHEGTVTVIGKEYDGGPEFQTDDYYTRGWLADLHEGGFITFDAEAQLPAPVRPTELGVLALTAVFSIIPPSPAVTMPDAPMSGTTADDEDDFWKENAPDSIAVAPPSTVPPASASRASATADGAATINYYGLGPLCLDFANSPQFRAIISKYGYELRIDDHKGSQITLAGGQPMSGDGYLSVVDPKTGTHLYVLYDDETWSNLESPGFVEILTLMDEYCKERFQSRIFMYMPEDEDDETDEIDTDVELGHPFYDREFDFATGQYREA